MPNNKKHRFVAKPVLPIPIFDFLQYQMLYPSPRPFMIRDCPNMTPPDKGPKCCFYDYLVVVDFEATCEESPFCNEKKPWRIGERPEIIQFPAVLVDVRNKCIVDWFNSYVKPVEKTILSGFCTKLTGITQEMVEKAPAFPEALTNFEQWLDKHRLNKFTFGRTFAIVTDGSFDIGHFLYRQCLISKKQFPEYVHNWINIRHSFRKCFRKKFVSLKLALTFLGEEFDGQPHNGLDDAHNIAKIVLHLIHSGYVISTNEKLIFDPKEQLKNGRRILNNKKSGLFDLATVVEISGVECLHLPFPDVMCSYPPLNDERDYQFSEELVELKQEEIDLMKIQETKRSDESPGSDRSEASDSSDLSQLSSEE